jgi:hypothetical protein
MRMNNSQWVARFDSHPGAISCRRYGVTMFAAVLLALNCASTAGEVQFVPLTDYIGQPGIATDPAALGYIAERCSALYAVFGKNLEGETDPERQRIMAETHSSAEKFMGLAARQMMRGMTIEMKDAFARTANIVVQLGNLYTDRIDSVRLRQQHVYRPPDCG